MGRQIPVAELEPCVVSQAPQLFEHDKGVASDPPTVVRIAQARQRVSDRVDIGRNMEAVNDRVVAGIADDGELSGIDFSGEAFDELGAAGAAGESDEHYDSSDKVLE